MTIRQRLSLTIATLLAMLGLVAAVGAAPAGAAPKTQAPATVSAPITGRSADGSTFAGTFVPKSFAAQNGSLVTTGLLTGTLTDPSGNTVGTVSKSVTAPAAVAAASCQVLNLVLGPLHLNLLGLVVDLNQVHLVINAEPGPGNLVGNLLCAITHLLDGTPAAGALAALLNSLLALLSGL